VLPDDYDLPVFEGATVHFVIHYPPPREEAALLLARRLFAELDLRIESMTLVPGETEDFDLWLDGERVHSTAQSGGEPSAARGARLAWARIEAAQGPSPADSRI
jgi:hypothetical protein